MNHREITLATINGLRIVMAQQIIAALNNHWNVAAFGKLSLNHKRVLQLLKIIKDCRQRIQSICQSQSNYVPWTHVRNKKRSHEHEEGQHPTKLPKIEEDQLTVN